MTETPEGGKFDRAKYLRTVRALLAQAQDPAVTKEEAEAFTAKANELMARYDLNVALDAARDKTKQDPIGDYLLPIRGSYATDFYLLLHNVCNAVGVRAIRKSGSTRTMVDVHLFGPMSTIERVDMLFTSLTIQALREISRAKLGASGAKLAEARRNWLYGFTQEIKGRLEAIEARTRAEADAKSNGGTSTALVVQNRAQLTDQAVKVVYPKLTSTTYRRGGAGEAAGRDAGRRADLGQTRAGGGRVAIGS